MILPLITERDMYMTHVLRIVAQVPINYDPSPLPCAVEDGGWLNGLWWSDQGGGGGIVIVRTGV